MREILFRGKRLDNGEWIEGASFNTRNEAFYICPTVSDITYGDNGKRRRIGCWYAVDLFTVGQYTGLTDKNGKQIFEGDILSIPFEEDRSPYEENSIYYEKGEVYFDTERYGWYVRFREYNDEISLWEYDNTDIEVISNIYDNPELLAKRAGVEQ